MAGRSALAAAGNVALCLSGKPLVGFTTVDGRIDFVALRCNEAVGACKCFNLSLYDYSESCECPVGDCVCLALARPRFLAMLLLC